jgi:hypothetical protein
MNDLFGIDTIIALGLIGIVIIIFIITRIGTLPKKSLPYIIAALAAAFGIYKIYNLIGSSKKAMGRIKELEKDIAVREKNIIELKKNLNLSDQKLQELLAELEQHKAAAERELLQMRADSKIEKERIDKLSGEDLHEEFRRSVNN